MKRALRLSILCLVVLPASVQAAEAANALKHQPSPEGASLQVQSQSRVDLQGFHSYRDGFKCDGNGNVFFLPYDTFAIVRVPSAGVAATRVDLSRALGASPERTRIESIALDPRGELYAILSEANDKRETRQYVVSFDNLGGFKSKVELDAQEIVAQKLAAFGSDGFLLTGRGLTSVWPRVAIADSGGRVLKDVEAPVNPATRPLFEEPEARAKGDEANMKKTFAVAAADGRVYFARDGGPIYGIAPSGVVAAQIPLAPAPGGAVLQELKASGQRLAVIYNERQKQPATALWVDVYDTTSGSQLARYGPIDRWVMCYSADGKRDRLALLSSENGQQVMVQVSPPTK